MVKVRSMIRSAALLVCIAPLVAALGQKQCIQLSDRSSLDGHEAAHQHPFPSNNHLSSRDNLVLASSKGHALPILLDSNDDYAIHIAARNFANDIATITGTKPKLYNDTLPKGTKKCILVGSIKSGLVGGSGLSQVEDLRGQWESFDTRVQKGVRDLDEALVIVGSDRRGTIFGLYDLSEQMGVSPWYWWDDVHTPRHDTISFSRREICAHGPPTVKYRGIFINDEIPVMWNWAKERFNISHPESPFQVGVYEKVFETMLRMKANYFWPAMWVSMFDVDGLNPQQNGLPKDPIPGPNQVLAHKMGIVMGSSHHEPMARNKPEWDLEGEGDWDWRTNEEEMKKWWTYGAERAKGLDTVLTMGMRGDGDAPLYGASKELLEEIAHGQQEILKKTYGTEDLSGVPQTWCLYKEVSGYYLDGLEVPDDVTMMFADDNWGNIMSVLPWGSNHTAGGGIYYHADYVGRPTQYKWINTINLAKTWEQMNIAKSFRTTNIWIINVGDVKHHELPAEHFLHLAYDFDAWGKDSTFRFLSLWAEREFGSTEKHEIADIVARYSMYTARLKPELYRPNSFSMINYEEAERVLTEWNALADRTEKVMHRLPRARRIAFFEYVYAPVMLVANANRMYLSVGWNNLHSDQARTSTNRWGEKAIAFFQQDLNITKMYHSLLDGKWDHILSQPHLNQKHFLHQLRDTVPPINYIQEDLPALPRWDGTIPGGPSYVRYTVENSFGAYPGHNWWNCKSGYDCGNNPTLYRMDPYGAKSRWVDVGAGGPMDSTWKGKSTASWIKIKPDHGHIKRDGTTDTRVYISVDWDQLPDPPNGEDVHHDNATIEFWASEGSNVTVIVPVSKPRSPPKSFKGHIQGDGYVVIEAGHWTRNTSKEGYSFEEIPWYGRTLSGMEMFPTTNINFTAGTGPSLEYDWWHTGEFSNDWDGKVNVTIQIGPTFNFIPHEQIAFAFQTDQGDIIEFHPVPPIDVHDLDNQSVPPDWDAVVSTEIRNVTASISLENAGKAGKHTVKLFGMTSGVVVERMWLDFGGIQSRGYSFLGPPESTIV